MRPHPTVNTAGEILFLLVVTDSQGRFREMHHIEFQGLQSRGRHTVPLLTTLDKIFLGWHYVRFTRQLATKVRAPAAYLPAPLRRPARRLGGTPPRTSPACVGRIPIAFVAKSCLPATIEWSRQRKFVQYVNRRIRNAQTLSPHTWTQFQAES